MTAVNVWKLAFSMIALAMLFAALTVSTSSTADGAERSQFVITGGKTTLKPTKQMVRKLKRAKVRVRPTGSATGDLRKLVFPITGGREVIGAQDLYPWREIRHKGSGFKIMKRVDGTSPLAFRNPVVDSRDLMIWIGDVGNEVVLRLSETDLLQAEDGPIRFRAKLKLTKQSAKLVRKRLGLNVKKGTTFGIIASKVERATTD